jgi:hypothetical protein
MTIKTNYLKIAIVIVIVVSIHMMDAQKESFNDWTASTLTVLSVTYQVLSSRSA